MSGELEKPTLLDAFKFWLKFGFISFGGPAGQIALMQRELVEQRKWIDSEDFLHALNFCMLLPGPEAQQLATYCGWKMHGIKGGIIAGAFFVIPSIFLLLVLSYIYAQYGSIPQINAVLNGFKAVVVAIVVEAVLKIGKKAFKSYWYIIISALAFIAIFFLHIPFPIIVLTAFFSGLIASKFSVNDSDSQANIQEIKRKTNIFKVLAVCLFLWLVPFLTLLYFLGFESLPVKNYLFFTQAAFVTFGGAYAVLAYVNQAVVSSGLITARQSVDGLALAETTPGPLIMVLQFVGFMAGWNHPGELNQLFSAILCALIATYTTFLPSFMFIFVGAQYVDKLRQNRYLASGLSFVTAAVVGVILNLALTFGSAITFPDSQIDIFAILLSIAAFIALYFLKIDVLLIVILGGLCGFAKFFLIG